MARIELKQIEKRWGSVIGVRDANIDIADREFLVLLGPSGCGKTTTMRMIAGLEFPTRGEIFMDGELVNEVDARDRDVAMVFQGYALYPNMSIYENIRFPLRMRNVPKQNQDTLIQRAARMVEMTDYLDRKPAALSGGQRQRAALARAIVRSPQVFLMDEPLSNLDAKLRQSMRIQLKQLQRQLEITTVYVTHDQVEAMTLADRIVVMDQGMIQQIGTPDEIYTNPANTFVASFIGSPPMNLITGVVDNGNFSQKNVTLPVADPGANGDVTLGIRPEDCRVSPLERANLTGKVYGVEPTGDATYLTVACEGFKFEVKADRGYREELDADVGVVFDSARLYFFDNHGQRIR